MLLWCLTPYSWVSDIQELHLPLLTVFLLLNMTVLKSVTCKSRLVQRVMGLELDSLMCNKDGDRHEYSSFTLTCSFFVNTLKSNNLSHTSQELGMTHHMMFEALLCTGT